MRFLVSTNVSRLSSLVAFTLLASVAGQITDAPNLSTADKGTSTTAAATTGSDSKSGSTAATTTDTTSGTTQTGSTTSLPGLSSTTDSGGLTGLPKLSGGYTIPTATVPPTSDAPFMQSSSLPEGTVFIIVGSILGFLALVVLAWRAGTAYSLHRSIKRAAYAGIEDMDKKVLFRTPAAPIYSYNDRGSKASLGGFPTKKSGLKNPFTAATESAQSLFFSPTAGAAGGTAAGAANRASTYLPSGYYAAGAAAPGDGRGNSYIGSREPVRESISLNNLRPHSQGYARANATDYEPSPPGTPGSDRAGLAHGHEYNLSTSTLDLGRGVGANMQGQGRAPSAVLDDLFNAECGGRRH